MYNIRPLVFALGLLVWLSFISNVKSASAFDFADVLKDTAAVGLAYTTHLIFHELGHQVVADQVGAVSHRMDFFTFKNGKFFPGLSTYKFIPEGSKLPYAVGGDYMSSHIFEYALDSYRREPTTFNKALMVFSCADFFAYTILANYVFPNEDMFAPNLIRAETGYSKEMLMLIVTTKTLLNTYRIIDKNAKISPHIWLDKTSAALMIRYKF